MSGSYGLVFISTFLYSAGTFAADAQVVREIGDGTITFDPRAGTFELTGDSLGINQIDLGICLPKNVQFPVQWGEPLTASGVYNFTGTKLILTITKSSDIVSAGTKQFYMNRDATVGIGGQVRKVRQQISSSTSLEPGLSEFVIFAKTDPEPVPPSGSYHAVTLESVLKQFTTFGPETLRERQQSIQTGVGELTIGGGFTLHTEKLISTVVCSEPTLPPLPGTPANLSNVSVTQAFATQGTSGSFSRRHFSGNGTIGLLANARPSPSLPLIAENYPLFQPGLGILGRQGAGMNASNLSGTFKVVSLSFQESLGLSGPSIPLLGGSTGLLKFEAVVLSDGMLNFDGAGNVVVSAVGPTMTMLAYSCSWPISNPEGLGSCNSERRIETVGGIPVNSYSLGSTGQLDLEFSGEVLTKGFVDPSGTFFVTVGGKKPIGTAPVGDRRIIVGVKQ